MLKSLFESSIDKLNISAEMKDAIKKINRVCLEAEGQEKDPAKNYNYEAYPSGKSIMKEDSDERVAAQKKDVEAKKNGQEKDTSVKGVDPDVEKTAKNGWNYDVTEDINKNSKEDKKETEEKGDTKKAAPTYRADVATVQFFLNATEPNKKIAADGMLGPRTIGLIQETEDLKPTGKMDKETQEAFNKLLAEAKEKVKAVQAKLGVTQDGLIGKQTLAALQKANMQVASVFSDNPQVPANAQPAQQQVAQPQQAQPQQQAQNVTSIKFNEAQAQQFLKNKTISQQEYNIWKQYGIAPKFQRQNPQGTQTQIAAMQQKQKEANTGTPVGKSVTSIPFDEAKAQQQLKSNQIKQQEYNIWKQYGIAPIFQRKNPQGTQAQIAKAQQGNKQQPQQQQQAAQPQQQAAQVNAKPAKQATPQQKQANTAYLSGNPNPQTPDEKAFYEKTRKNLEQQYLAKAGNDGTRQQLALEKAANDAGVALLKFRQSKQGT